MKSTSIIISCLIGLVAGLSAQSENSLFRADFRVLPILSADWTGIFYQPAPDEKMAELEFRSLARSFDTYKYVGPNPLRFYRENGLNEEGEMIYKEVGQVTLSSSEALVFFMKQAEKPKADSMEFSLLAMNDSPRGLPLNHIAFVNFMPVPFGCRFVEKNIMLQPGISQPISLEDKLGEDLFVGLVLENENSHRVVLRNNWEFRTGNRHLILLLPPKKAGSYRIRAYRVTEFVGENQRFNPSWSAPQLGQLQ
jgi:hypothetical protein